MSDPLPPQTPRRRAGLRPRRRQHRPTLSAIFRLIVVFVMALAVFTGFSIWRDLRDHDQFGPGRIVVSPH